MAWICAENNVDNQDFFFVICEYWWAGLTESRLFLLLTLFHQWGSWGCTRSWETTPQLAPGIAQTIWCQVYHTELGNKKGRGMFGVMVFVFPTHRYCYAFLRMAEHLPAYGSFLLLLCFTFFPLFPWVPCFTLLVHTVFSSPIKLSLSQPTSSVSFTLPILSLIPPGMWVSG